MCDFGKSERSATQWALVSFWNAMINLMLIAPCVIMLGLYNGTCVYRVSQVSSVQKKKKADTLANLKMIFPQRKCRGTNSFRVIND